MQVSQDLTNESVAVLGGGRKREFSAKASGHMFRTMSDTLYSDKIKAVVREVICNAVDAHIVAGKADIPVEIALTDNDFIVKDFGPGIHDDRIADIFCSLFASTKGDDESQTGGFGLGSKAPFSITDHFTVTSCHNGTRTIYSMHKTGNADGLPVCQTMVSAPCGEETGLIVSIPIEEGKKRRFDANISSIIYYGGINATLNGKKLKTVDYTEIKKIGYGVIKPEVSGGNGVNILLGNVIYPVPDSHTWNFNRITHDIYDYELVIYAEPGTAIPLPSREGLSVNETTQITLDDAIARIQNKHVVHLNRLIKKINYEAVKKCGRFGLYEFKANALKYANELLDAEFSANSSIAGDYGIALAKLKNAINNQSSDWKKLAKIAAQVINGARRMGKFKQSSYFYESKINEINLQYSIKQIIKAVGPDISKLHIFNTHYYRRPTFSPIRSGRYYKRPDAWCHDEWDEGYRVERILILGRLKRDVEAFVKQYPDSSERFFTLISTSLKEAEIDQLRGRCEKFGFTTLVAPSIAAAPKPKKPKKKIVEADHEFMAFETTCTKTPDDRFSVGVFSNTLIKTPGFYAQHAIYKSKDGRLHGIKGGALGVVSSSVKFIGKLFPDSVMAQNEPEIKILRSRGIKSIGECLVEELVEAAKTNQDFVAFAYACAYAHYSGKRQTRGNFSTEISDNRAVTCFILNEPYVDDPALDRIWNLMFAAVVYFKGIPSATFRDEFYNQKKAIEDLFEEYTNEQETKRKSDIYFIRYNSYSVNEDVIAVGQFINDLLGGKSALTAKDIEIASKLSEVFKQLKQEKDENE